MTNINTCKDPCFAFSKGTRNCTALSKKCTGRKGCPFYKPADCKEWIRVVRDGEEWIMPPEEYYG